MAPRPFWKGYLKFSLVTCPVVMTPAVTDGERVRFHLINAKTGNRLVSVYRDSVTNEIVDKDDQTLGYPLNETDFIPIEDEDFEAVQLETSRTIEIDNFIGADDINPIWLNRAHYLTPSDKVGEEAFCVIRDAMIKSKTNAVARLVLYRREQAVFLIADGKGITLWTSRFANEVRPAEDYFGGDKLTKPNPGSVKLIKQLINKDKIGWATDRLVDPVRENLAKLIEQRKKQAKKQSTIKTAKPNIEREKNNVINIMDALRKSIAADKNGTKKKDK